MKWRRITHEVHSASRSLLSDPDPYQCCDPEVSSLWATIGKTELMIWKRDICLLSKKIGNGTATVHRSTLMEIQASFKKEKTRKEKHYPMTLSSISTELPTSHIHVKQNLKQNYKTPKPNHLLIYHKMVSLTRKFKWKSSLNPCIVPCPLCTMCNSGLQKAQPSPKDL